MKKPELTKFQIPEEDRELFEALDTARQRLRELAALKAIVEEYESTERILAAKVFSKFGIPPNQTISFSNWIVTAVGEKELRDPIRPKTKKGPAKKKAKKKAKKMTPGR